MSHYFGYIRVSTIRQGEQGVSLQEQRDAILRYAASNCLQVGQWFEERVTAAKCGRPLFVKMLRELRQGRAAGVIIHKIDRSARNLRDWANLGELIDEGVDVRFAHDSIDLSSRGGRLSADIQAVVASDYIRNLREETRKGMNGRLKQGLYPFAAPTGYVNNGGGKAKTPCPGKGPLITKAFDLYASGNYGIDSLADEMYRAGLRSAYGSRIGLAAWARILHNPFYAGLIRLRQSGEVLPGVHEPLVSLRTFNCVQEVLAGRTPKRGRLHQFLFRQLFTCGECGRALIGETQKGHVYYRCHLRDCRATCLREEQLADSIQSSLQSLEIEGQVLCELREEARKMQAEEETEWQKAFDSIHFQEQAVSARLDRLMDAYLDSTIDQDAYRERKSRLVQERGLLQERLREMEVRKGNLHDDLENLLEQAKSPWLSYELALDDEKRAILKNVYSNRTVLGKNVATTMHFVYQCLAECPKTIQGDPNRGTTRTFLKRLLEALGREPLKAWEQNRSGNAE